MEVALVQVAEELAADFASLPPTTVVRVVTDCVDEFPNDEAHFIAQAARARLTAEHPLVGPGL